MSELFGKSVLSNDAEIRGITCDSRMIKQGFVFVCLKGSRDNGLRYADEAMARGAIAVISQCPIQCKIPVLLCDEPRRLMAQTAKKIFDKPDEKMLLAGVTGTNGKTTVSHLFRDIMLAAGHRSALIGTNGCYINKNLLDESFTTSTTPEAGEFYQILNNALKLGADNAVCEVSSHALELDRVLGADFDAAVFTNLTPDHLDYHKSMERYFMAKQKLFDMSRLCVINTDDEYGKRLYKKFRYKSVSAGLENADFTAKNIVYTEKSCIFDIVTGNKTVRAEISIPGRFSVYNALLAYAAANSLGTDENISLKALKNTEGVRGRAERVETGRDFGVIIDYAHTPDGLENIIKALKISTKGRIITVFGCGGDRDKSKRAVMGTISGSLSDYTVITSDNPRYENPEDIIRDIRKGIESVTDNFSVIPDRYEAIRYALLSAKKGDTVLLAGKGHEDYIIIKDKKIHFDEREAVKNILKNIL